MSSLTRSQSLRAPSSRPIASTSASTGTVTTRSAARAAASTSATAGGTGIPSSIAAPSARPRPQTRTASPAVPTRQHARTVSAGSISSCSSRTATATTTTITTTATTTTTNIKPPSRSLSASLLGRPKPAATTPAAGGGALKELPQRKETRHYPPSTALTRPPVTPRPRSSMGITSSSPPVTRLPTQLARPRSSAANREPTTPQPQTLRRPLSHASTRTPGAASPTVQHRTNSVEKGAKAQQPPPPRPLSLGLSKSARAQPARPPSASGVPSSSSTTTTSRTTPTPTPTVSRVRSGFSTVQRHYSPSASPAPTPPPSTTKPAAPPSATRSLAKPAPRTASKPAPRPAPKPAALKTSVSSQYLRTSTATPATPSRSPVRSPANVPPSSEISRLQAELLQLYLLHDEAVATDAAWRASAKAKLGERFLRISEDHQAAADKERTATECINVLALSRWSARGSTSLDERIQALEAIISGCWALSNPGGRYAAVVCRFEDWVDGVTGVQEARRRPEAALGNEDVLFIGELDAEWKAEREDLMQRLDGWRKQLDEIDDLDAADGSGEDERSGLERMLGAARSLIGDMAAELDVMGVIEREARQQEEEWIERMNNQDDEGALRTGPAWRA